MLSVSCILLILYKMRQYHQIKKKFKNKKFAAKIDCNHILDGCTLTGITFDEAIDKAVLLAREKMLMQLSDDEEILYEKKLKTTQNNSTIIVEVFFKVYENITSYQEILENIEINEDKG